MMAPRHTITTILAVALATTVAVIGWETDWGRALHSDAPLPSSDRVATIDSKILPAYGLAPMESNYKETVERPLFISTRRPAPASTNSQTVMKKGQFKLAGTTISAGASVAYLFETANNKTHRVSLGGDINGIKVERVEATRVVLKQGDDSEELSLRTSPSPKVVAPQVAAAPAPGQPGQPAQPGVPGGGPPMPQTAQAGPGAMQNQFAGGAPMAAAPGSGVPQAGRPLPPNSRPVTDPTGETAAPAADPIAATARRRRFQNLPQ